MFIVYIKTGNGEYAICTDDGFLTGVIETYPDNEYVNESYWIVPGTINPLDD